MSSARPRSPERRSKAHKEFAVALYLSGRAVEALEQREALQRVTNPP